MNSSEKGWHYFEHPGFTYPRQYIHREQLPNYFQESTEDTPVVKGLFADNFFAIGGRCLFSDAFEGFMPIIEWIEYYLTSKPEKIRVEFWLDYFNTAASRMLLIIFLGFDKYQMENPQAQVNVYWYFHGDDEDMEKAGEDFQSELKALKLNIIPTDSSSHYEDMRKIFNRL